MTAGKTGRMILMWIMLGLLSACAKHTVLIEPGVSLALAQSRAERVSEINYKLQYQVPEQSDIEIIGQVSISFLLSDIETPLQLDFAQSAEDIGKVLTNQHRSGYRFVNQHLVIPRSELRLGQNQIDIEFSVDQGTLNRNPEYLYTLFVPDRARSAFPLFDQPDLKATYDLSLTVPNGWQAISNGPIASISEGDSVTEYRFRKSDLISSYLFSFVAGKFERVTRQLDGRSITMLHRETDAAKLARNIDVIFELHAAALVWMEDYTGIPYPFQKFDFALIPTFQYGGMEHVGAIQYRASTLLLDESPSDSKRLNRASLIAHETAHMWFGDLVTMRWFNDVWTKEVFANFMAAKIVNPSFPEINHRLNFLVDLYPGAYSVDRTSGANPIRQDLYNLNQAGQMYGAIIYNKAPIMMRQLEALIGADEFQAGLRRYLQKYAFDNATWPDLIAILDGKSDQDLQAWSKTWVNSAGRPEFDLAAEPDTGLAAQLLQTDLAGNGRVWPQQFELIVFSQDALQRLPVMSVATTTAIDIQGISADRLVFNSDGFGYGLFPAKLADLQLWQQLDEVARGTLLINLYEQFLTGQNADAPDYALALQEILAIERNQLLLDLTLGQLQRVYWGFLTPEQRLALAPALETQLWKSMLGEEPSSRLKTWFDAFASIAISEAALQKTQAVWSGAARVEGLKLSERDRIGLAQLLAIKLPDSADQIITTQLSQIQNPDDRRKLEFLAASVSASQAARDMFFASLALAENRQIESWVLLALRNLHHPLRTKLSEKYLPPSLTLLQEIQVTGDIFFPKGWLTASFANYNSDTAIAMVNDFLLAHPNYNLQLRMKIEQSTDLMVRANRILQEAGTVHSK
jgi:aminopeptidase N